jgi:hypothetical protein
MAKAINIKSLFLGSAIAFAGFLVGEGIARAECPDGLTYSEALADVLEGAGRGYRCEVIELRDGSFEAQCDEVALPGESRACSAWAYGFDEIGDTDAEGMYEACMVIALHTGAVQ